MACKRSTVRSRLAPPRKVLYGGIAQLGEHLLCKQGVIGSIPFTSTIDEKKHSYCGVIAQLGERLHGMQEVNGSIPFSSTT